MAVHIPLHPLQLYCATLSGLSVPPSIYPFNYLITLSTCSKFFSRRFIYFTVSPLIVSSPCSNSKLFSMHFFYRTTLLNSSPSSILSWQRRASEWTSFTFSTNRSLYKYRIICSFRSVNYLSSYLYLIIWSSIVTRSAYAYMQQSTEYIILYSIQFISEVRRQHSVSV